MKKIFFTNKLLVLGLLFICLSCEKAEYDKEYSATHPISGDWTVKVVVGSDIVNGPFFMKIYNTSFSKDSVWIDDNGGLGPAALLAKVKVDMTNKTFSSILAINQARADSIIFTNGKTIGQDSIYFEAEFSDDPGTVYKYSGHRKLSYEEYNTH